VFTHEPTTPARLEALVELVRSGRRWTEKAICDVLQPETLPAVKSSSGQAEKTLSAAKQLGLIVESPGGFLTLKFDPQTQTPSRDAVLAAFDERVLGDGEIEPYFAAFYSFVLSRDEEGARDRTGPEWARAFVTANPWAGGTNPFNKDKLSGMHRWLGYAGLGWYDPRDVFQCNPYDRLRRRLPSIFATKAELTAADFFGALAAACLELDGGATFLRAVPQSDRPERRCTLGLSHALIELHQDGVLRLHCLGDSDGWFIGHAEPPLDEFIKSERIDRVELLSKGVA
jgi:hypothetical protein